ncbi:MAG: hypothetical protein HKN04_07680 [Rhodothermaceae bacterium]|nr:hypothetical protein [Rhodothermaceae bacterium]
MHEHTISVPRTARYALLGPEEGPVDEVWMVAHGYGQLARYFARPFATIQAERRLIAAPEALHHFYLDDAHRRVGASWMTREHRLAAISDYVGYLDAVFVGVCVRAHADPRTIRLVALGFSQGTATVSRWLDQSPLLATRARRADWLLLWGSGLPHDLDLPNAAWLSEADLTLVVGEQDAYLTPERVAGQETALREAAIPYRVVRYDGEHRIEPEVLRRLAEEPHA